MKNVKMLHDQETDQHSAVAFSNDSRLIAIGFEDGNITVLETSLMRQEYFYKVHQKKILKILFTEDQKFIISMSYENTYTNIKIWNTINKTLHHTFYSHSAEEGISHNFGNYLITPCVSRYLTFWNLKEKIREFDINTQYLLSKVSYHGKYTSVIYDDHIDIWKLLTVAENGANDFYPYTVPIKISNNKKYAVSGHEKHLKLWNVDQENEILSFKAHKGWIRAVSFSYDSRFFISGGDDGFVKIWDLNGKELQCFTQHSSWVLTVAFSRDGKFVVSGSHNKVILIWEVGTDYEVKAFRDFDCNFHSISFCRSRKFIIVVKSSQKKIEVLKV